MRNLDDTCKEATEYCRSDCCEGTHSFCSPDDTLSWLRGNMWCVSCRSDHDCPGDRACKDVGTRNAKCAKGAIVPVEGMDLILQGYDIFLSDPLRTKAKSDQGIKDTPVFKHDYEDSSETPEGFTLPKRFVVVNEYPSCESSFSSESITTSSEMTKSIKKSVGVKVTAKIPTNAGPLDVGAGVGAGSYSTSAKNAMSRDMVVSSTARCETRVLRMNDYSSYPDLSNDLTSWLKNHFGTGTPSSYEALFENYGTHIARQLTIGAEFGATTVVSESQKSTLEKEGKNLETTLSVGIPLLFSVDTTTASTESIEARNSLATASIRAERWSIGGKTVSDDKSFYEGASTKPAPLKYENLESLCEVLETKDINNFDKRSCYSAMVPHCNSVMEGTKYNCNVMLGKKNERFDCVFNEHCPQPKMCVAGLCSRVLGIEVAAPNQIFNFEERMFRAVFQYENEMGTAASLNVERYVHTRLKFCYKGEEFLHGWYRTEGDTIVLSLQRDKNWDLLPTEPSLGVSFSIINKVRLEPEKYYFVVQKDQSCVGLGYKY